MTSSRAVSGFMATRKSISFLRPIHPCLLARMVNQVGRPAMFDGNMFLPDTGMPIWKMERISTVLAVWLPEPFTVATCMLKSLVTAWSGSPWRGKTGDTSRVDIDSSSFYLGECVPVHCFYLIIRHTGRDGLSPPAAIGPSSDF